MQTETRTENPTTTKGGTNPLFATSKAFGERMKTRGTEKELLDERSQLERQGFVNATVTQRTQRVGGWLAIDATLVLNQSVASLSVQLAPTVTAVFNGCNLFGKPLTEQDVTRILSHMNTTRTSEDHTTLVYTVGRTRARIMTTHLSTSEEDVNAFTRLVTELTLQVAIWCERTTTEQIRKDSTVETRIQQMAEHTIKAHNALGAYARLLPGLLIVDINVDGTTTSFGRN